MKQLSTEDILEVFSPENKEKYTFVLEVKINEKPKILFLRNKDINSFIKYFKLIGE